VFASDVFNFMNFIDVLLQYLNCSKKIRSDTSLKTLHKLFKTIIKRVVCKHNNNQKQLIN